MQPGGHVFQVYRTGPQNGRSLVDAALYWWRLISSNGRPLGCAVDGFGTGDDARRGLAEVVTAADRLAPAVRATPEHRWTWTLSLDGVPLVRGVGTYDRHVRCDMAWRRFVLAAPMATVDDDLHEFHRGTARSTPSALLERP